MSNGKKPPQSTQSKGPSDKVVHLNAFKDIDSASDQAIEWLARLRAEDLGESEIGAFAEWLAASSEHKRAFDEASELWAISGAALEHLPNIVLAEPEPIVTYRPWQPFAIAATFLLTCLMVLIQLQAPTFNTGKGEQRKVVLADGSTAFLNTNTELQVHFSVDERRIELIHGEAWFDVRKDSSRPFVVVGDYASATAVGTAFTVRNNDQFTRIAVTEGSVRVLLDEPIGDRNHINGLGSQIEPSGGTTHNTWQLAPEQAMRISASALRALAVDPSVEQAWQRGQLIYKDVSLEHLIADLNRYLPVTLTINDPELAQRKLSAILQLDDHAAMLEALSQVLPIKWKNVSDQLVILTRV